MGILELQIEKNNLIKNIYDDSTTNIESNNRNSTSINFPNENYYHKNYLYLLLLLTLIFFVLSYYLYLISKIFIKKSKITNNENLIIFLKYTNLQNLSIANFSN